MRLCALYFFSSRKDLPAVGNCKEIVLARYFFRRPLRLPCFARPILFLFSQRRRDAKELCSLGITSGGLCVLATLRALFFFFSQRPACGRQLQRNCGRSVFLPEAFAAWHICSLPRRIAGSQILFLFFTRAETQRNHLPSTSRFLFLACLPQVGLLNRQ